MRVMDEVGTPGWQSSDKTCCDPGGGHGEGHPGFGDAGPGSGRAVSSPCQLRGMLPARSRAHPKPAAPIPKEEKAFMRSQQGAGAAESPQSPPVNPGISRLGATLAWILLAFLLQKRPAGPQKAAGAQRR